tara:strand:+ start:3294 stop:3647 length:354 start_codon:yes stop_codon:yes gene_type:complete
MKKLKLTIAVIALCFSTLAATATETKTLPSKSSKNLRSKIIKLLGNEAPNYLTEGNDVKAELSFMLNNKNQIILVTIDSKSDLVEGYVKSKLNYQKVSVKGLKSGEIYRVPLTIKQS